jgi:drug/metabolite transporter (DMT)-like permease
MLVCLFEAILIVPFLIQERLHAAKGPKGATLKPLREHLGLLVVVGVVFGLALILYVWGVDNSGAIIGSMAMKTQVVIGLIWGALLLKEKATWRQFFFSLLLLFGLAIALTGGTMQFEAVTIGVLALIVVANMWTVGHSIVKPRLIRGEVLVTQVIFVRQMVGFLVLLGLYLALNPGDLVAALANPQILLWALLMAVAYGGGHIFWYRTLRDLPVGQATAMGAPNTIGTVILAALFLGELVTVYHIAGLAIVLVALFCIII